MSVPAFAGNLGLLLSATHYPSKNYTPCTAAGMCSAASLPVSLSVPNLVMSKVTSQAVMEGREAPESPASTQSPALGEQHCLYHALALPQHNQVLGAYNCGTPWGAEHVESRQCIATPPRQGFQVYVRLLPGMHRWPLRKVCKCMPHAAAGKHLGLVHAAP